MPLTSTLAPVARHSSGSELPWGDLEQGGLAQPVLSQEDREEAGPAFMGEIELEVTDQLEVPDPQMLQVHGSR